MKVIAFDSAKAVTGLPVLERKASGRRKLNICVMLSQILGYKWMKKSNCRVFLCFQ